MELVDLKGFEGFLDLRKMVPERHRSFYVKWVQRFLRSEFSVEELSGKDQLTCFADQLGRGMAAITASTKGL